jgi:hypothetical protein
MTLYKNGSGHHVQNEIVGYIINWPQNISFYCPAFRFILFVLCKNSSSFQVLIN